MTPMEEVLQQILDALVRNNDTDGAAQVVELMTLVVAADELEAALRRGDGEAVAFHAGLLVEHLAGPGPRVGFEIADQGSQP